MITFTYLHCTRANLTSFRSKFFSSFFSFVERWWKDLEEKKICHNTKSEETQQPPKEKRKHIFFPCSHPNLPATCHHSIKRPILKKVFVCCSNSPQDKDQARKYLFFVWKSVLLIFWYGTSWCKVKSTCVIIFCFKLAPKKSVSWDFH